MKPLPALLALAILSIAAVAQNPKPPDLTIENIFAEGGLTGRAPENVKWSPDGKKVSFVQRDDSGERGELYYIDVSTGDKAVLVAAEKLATLAPPSSKLKNEREREAQSRYSIAAYHWAPDSKRLLFDSGGQLWLYSLDNRTAVQITSSPGATDPKFSPGGERVAYLRAHNIYVARVSGDSREITVTHDQPEGVNNGEVDWVYEEELDVRSNYFWSPDGKKIAFLQMDERLVPTYPIADYIPLQPTVDDQKYPKPGDPNPVVRLGIVGSEGGGVKWATLGADRDTYVPRFGWVNKTLLYAQVLNRAQNQMDLYLIEAGSGKTRLVLSEKSDTFLEVHDVTFLAPDRFLWQSWRDGHTHLYLYKFNSNDPLAADATLERQLTKGDYEVGDVSAVDEKTGTVYFGANEGDARQRNLYAVKLDGSGFHRLTKEAGHHEATFGSDPAKYVDKYSALLTPPSLSLCSVDGACRKFWESRSVAEYNLIAPKEVEFKADDGTVLYGLLLLPPSAANAPAHSLPLIMNPYGGPSGQVARNDWGGATFLFHQIMARRGFAILQVDNRGMGARGKKFASANFHKFGQVELADQLASLDQALAANPALDPNRLGWWGWSYGGFMTLFAMTHSDRFTTGVSVAPVTDWRDYDSIYTERYMGLPRDNGAGYSDSSPVNAAAKLHGRVLEVHGTGDDNVHLQNTYQMINAMIGADKQFDLMLYPRKTHGIAGAAARTHLFHRIQDQFEKGLMGAK